MYCKLCPVTQWCCWLCPRVKVTCLEEVQSKSSVSVLSIKNVCNRIHRRREMRGIHFFSLPFHLFSFCAFRSSCRRLKVFVSSLVKFPFLGCMALIKTQYVDVQIIAMDVSGSWIYWHLCCDCVMFLNRYQGYPLLLTVSHFLSQHPHQHVCLLYIQYVLFSTVVKASQGNSDSVDALVLQSSCWQL